MVVLVHLDGESWLLLTPWERNFIKNKVQLKWVGQSLNNLGPFHRSVVFCSCGGGEFYDFNDYKLYVSTLDEVNTK